MAAAISSEVTTRVRSAGMSGWSRPTVSAMSGRSPTRRKSCLGRCGDDNGQKRDPIPPAKTMAYIAVSDDRSSDAASCSAGSVPAALVLPNEVHPVGGVSPMDMSGAMLA